MADANTPQRALSHIFISYARADASEFAYDMHNRLEAAQINTWLDVIDIDKGDNFNASIDRALVSAWAVVVVLTPGSVLSDHVQSEWMYTLDHHFPLIPLYVIPCKIPRLLGPLNYIDFTQNFESAFQALVLRIQDLGTTHRAYLLNKLEETEQAAKQAADANAFVVKTAEYRLALKDWDGIPTPFISTASVRVHGDILSFDVPLFMDRTEFRQRLREALTTSSTRLISVLGRAGIGKTALVNRILQEIEQNQWPTDTDSQPIKGIVYLSALSLGITVGRIFTSCALLIGGENGRGLLTLWSNPYLRDEDKIMRLLETMSDATYILLLDNIEDLLTPTGDFKSTSLELFFEVALRTSTGVRILTTSRIPIALPSDVSFYDERINLSEGLPATDAISMLRLMDPHDEYGVGDQSDEILHQIVEVTHGVPRALELVISIMKSIRTKDLFADVSTAIVAQFYGLDDVVNTLARNAYQHLEEDERRIVEVLAVFRRPVSPEAVSFVIAKLGFKMQIVKLLLELQRAYTISANPSARTISLHPIDADLAYSEIPLGGEYQRTNVHRFAAEYYASVRTDPATWQSSDDIEPQLNEFDHLVRAGEFDLAAVLVDDLQPHLNRWENFRLIISLRTVLMDRIIDPTRKKQNLLQIGRAHAFMQHFTDVISLYQHLLTILDDSDPLELRAEILASIGWSSRGVSNLADTLHYLNLAMEMGANLSPRVLGEIYHNYGITYRNLGDIEKSRSYHEQEYAVCQTAGLLDGVGRAASSLGVLTYETHQYEVAEKYYQIAIQAAESSGKRQLLCGVLGNFGKLQQVLGRFDTAVESFQKAVRYAREINDMRYESIWLDSLGVVAYLLGHYDEAVAYHEESLSLARRVGTSRTIAFAMCGLARATNALRPEANESVNLLLDAYAIAKQTRYVRDQQAWGIALAEIYLQMKRFTDALAICQEVDGLVVAEEKYYAKLVYGLTIIATQQPKPELAQVVLQESVNLSNELLLHDSRHYWAHFVQGLAYLGLCLLADDAHMVGYIASSKACFANALTQLRAPGVLSDTRRLLSVLVSNDSNGRLGGIVTYLN